MEETRIRNQNGEDMFNYKSRTIAEQQKRYDSMEYKEKMLFNTERTAKNVSAIMWIMLLPIIAAGVFGLIYLVAR